MNDYGDPWEIGPIEPFIEEYKEDLLKSPLFGVLREDLEKPPEQMTITEKRILFYMGITALIGEKIGKSLEVDSEEYEKDLFKAGTIAMDKLWRTTQSYRRDYIPNDLEERERWEVVDLTGKEYFLGKGLILEEDEIKETLEGMKKYDKFFEKELEFYDIKEEDGEIVDYEIEDHDSFVRVRD